MTRRRKTTTAVDQCRDELGRAVEALAALGLDTAGSIDADQIDKTAQTITDNLAGDDAKLAGQTCADLMAALWPHGAPEQLGRPEWWTTPLGHLCARVLGPTDTESISHSVAAAMLDVHRGTVAQLVTRGTLDRHEDGGVSRASVLQRLAST